MDIHYQERDENGNITDFHFTEEKFRKEFSNIDNEPYPCYREMLNNVGEWVDNGRVVEYK